MSGANGAGRNDRPRFGYVIALAIGVGAGAISTLLLREKPQPIIEETRFLNFDPETTKEDMLPAGWSGYERNDHNDSFMWCMSQHCTLVVNANGQRTRRVSIRMWPFRYANAPPQSVVAKLNGALVGSIDFKEEPLVWQMEVDKSYWKDGKNTFRFDFNYAQTPAGHIDGSNDPRTLSAGFDWLEILPL